MTCDGTTFLGTLEDDLGEIRFTFCDACRTIAVDSWDARRIRRSWGITYVDPKTLERPRPAPTRVEFLARLRHLLA